MPNLNETLTTNQPSGCAVCEAMLPDAVDGSLTAAEQRAFDMHVASCVECSRELAEAQRGAAWLTMLKSEAPEPPAGMLDRILANTANAEQPAWALATTTTPTTNPGTPYLGSIEMWVRRTPALWTRFVVSAKVLAQPRLAMTAAMAFFSLALTFNLVGGKLPGGKLTPNSIARSAADLRASAVRSFQNQRVVYQFESSVTDLTNPADRDR